MKIESLKPGMTVYDVGRRKMGSTTISTIAVWPVHILSVDEQSGTVEARWNGNQARLYSGSVFKKWRAKKPMLVGTLTGGLRLATREEKAAAKAAGK